MKNLAIKIRKFITDPTAVFNAGCWFWSVASLILGAICLYLKLTGNDNHFWLSFLIPGVVIMPILGFPWWVRLTALIGQILST
jgi:hypothetical protein